jgi:hypothetical protein
MIAADLSEANDQQRLAAELVLSLRGSPIIPRQTRFAWLSAPREAGARAPASVP